MAATPRRPRRRKRRRRRHRALAQADVQISIQDGDAASADHIAGYDGAFARKRALAAEVVRHQLLLTVNAVVHRANIDRIGEMVDLALSLGASRIEIARSRTAPR
jgi:pyrroloquinoline quinone biosynthesis protein E